MTTPRATADIGLIGLAVMGENLVLNMASHGFTVAVFNRTTSKVDAFLAGRARGKSIVGTHTVQELVSSLKRPRKIMIMVKAGAPVDEVINELVPLLEPGDILIDGGNSHYPDSTRRTRQLKEKGILFIGTGVSGGEEGALHGPSIMPGGNPDAWPHVKPIFQAIAAKVADGTPCCDWVGPEGAGHFVKMVHNGIEYGDMQLICEAYHVMRSLLGMEPAAMHDVFARWNNGPLDSYLIEITRDILGFKRPRDRQADGRPDPRHRRPERHRQVDRDHGLRPRRALDLDLRGRLCPLPLGSERRTRHRLYACSRAIPHHLQATTSRWSTPSSRLSTPARSSPTPRASA